MSAYEVRGNIYHMFSSQEGHHQNVDDILITSDTVDTSEKNSQEILAERQIEVINALVDIASELSLAPVNMPFSLDSENLNGTMRYVAKLEDGTPINFNVMIIGEHISVIIDAPWGIEGHEEIFELIGNKMTGRELSAGVMYESAGKIYIKDAPHRTIPHKTVAQSENQISELGFELTWFINLERGTKVEGAHGVKCIFIEEDDESCTLYDMKSSKIYQISRLEFQATFQLVAYPEDIANLQPHK